MGGGGRFVAQVDPLSSKHYFVSHFQLIYAGLPLLSYNLCVIAHHYNHNYPHHYRHRSNAGYGPISQGVLAMPFVPIVDGEFLPTGHRIPVQMEERDYHVMDRTSMLSNNCFTNGHFVQIPCG